MKGGANNLMKKRILQIAFILLLLGLGTGYCYTRQNPIVIEENEASITIAGGKIHTPTGWTTGYNDYDNGEHIDMFLDANGDMRVAVATIQLAVESTFEELGPDYTKAICDEVLNEDDVPINEPEIYEFENCYLIEYQYNIENDLVYATFCMPLKSNYIYEVLEVKPAEETTNIKLEVLDNVRKQ